MELSTPFRLSAEDRLEGFRPRKLLTLSIGTSRRISRFHRFGHMQKARCAASLFRRSTRMFRKLRRETPSYMNSLRL